jgi:hypothetical protein
MGWGGGGRDLFAEHKRIQRFTKDL